MVWKNREKNIIEKTWKHMKTPSLSSQLDSPISQTCYSGLAGHFLYSAKIEKTRHAVLVSATLGLRHRAFHLPGKPAGGDEWNYSEAVKCWKWSCARDDGSVWWGGGLSSGRKRDLLLQRAMHPAIITYSNKIKIDKQNKVCYMYPWDWTPHHLPTLKHKSRFSGVTGRDVFETSNILSTSSSPIVVNKY